MAAPKGPEAAAVVPIVVDVDLGSRSYPYIGSGLLHRPDLLQKHVIGKKVLVVTNTTIAPLYLEKVIEALTVGNPNVSVECAILPDGEKYKNMVFDKAIETNLDRRCTWGRDRKRVVSQLLPSSVVLISFRFRLL